MATIIHDTEAGTEHVEVEAVTSNDRLLLGPEAFAALTGWTLKPEGMCRADVCAPIFDKGAVLAEGGSIDLAGAAPIIGLSAVVDAARGVAALSASAEARGADMTSLHAPDFTLPDLQGNPVSLHDFDRRKVLLLAWSSW